MGAHRLCKYLLFYLPEVPSFLRQYHLASPQITSQTVHCPFEVRHIYSKLCFLLSKLQLKHDEQ